MAELRLVRTLDRVENLKDGGRWSFRQPKKQRGVGGLNKTHWDYLMDEMVGRTPSVQRQPLSLLRNGCAPTSARNENGSLRWHTIFLPRF